MTRYRTSTKLLFVCILIGSVAGGIAAGAIFAFTRDLPQIRSLESFRPSAVTRIYSADHVLLDELYVERRDPVDLRMIPAYLKKALVATEDRSFYSHSGVDLKGIMRAIVRNIWAGEYVEGASTLTQQLAKTLFLTPRKTLKRKIKEAVLSFQLERRYTKDEILAFYLNQVYFGSGAYGVQSAARIFFGKSVSDLDLAQCALVAAMPKAPSRYSPLVDPVLARKRRNIVLRQMADIGIITEIQLKNATAAQLLLAGAEKSQRKAPYFVAAIKSFLEESLGSSQLYKGGLRVDSTLDFSLQQAAQQAAVSGVSRLSGRMKKQGIDSTDVQCALVCLDVGTGAIRAMIGGKDFKQSAFNRAVQARRQPGSAFKPIVYGLAIERGFEQSRQILDAPVVFKGGTGGEDWRPENFSRTYQGEITLREALALSKNIPAVRLIEILGPSAVTDFARKLGIRSTLEPNLSLALGTSETTLLELTAAYAVFANRGERVEPHGVERVVGPSGRIIWQADPRKAVVMSRKAAAILVDMLQAVVNEGTGRMAQRIRRPVAGKTGTTNDCRDALFVGFSPEVCTGVWVGQDHYVSLGRGETGARAALPIWTQFMTRALENRSVAYFDIPDGTLRVLMDPVTGGRARAKDPGAVSALFRSVNQPPDLTDR